MPSATTARDAESRALPSTYVCSCEGYRTLRILSMCLPCLDAYSAGIQHTLRGQERARHMRLVAKALLLHLNGDPITVGEALRAADRRPAEFLLPDGRIATFGTKDYTEMAKMTEKQDKAADKKAGIKEGSRADDKLDKSRGLPFDKKRK